jgi:predicted double-glycine peptidase
MYRLGSVPLAALLAACSSYAGSARDFAPAALAREPGWIAVAGVDPVRQDSESSCGAAAIAMVVSYWTGASADQLVAELGPVPERGLSAGRLRRFARGHGLAAFLVQADLSDLEHEVRRGRPVLVGLVKPQRRGVLTHYEVVVALHLERGRIVTVDPGHGWRENSVEGFLTEWRPVRGLALVVSAAPVTAGSLAPAAAARSRAGEPGSAPPAASTPGDRSGPGARPARRR